MFSKSQFLNVLKSITNSVAFYWKFATFINFLKNRIFFVKMTHPFLQKKHPIFERFENLFLQWPCSATLLLLAIFEKKVTSFSRNPSSFSIKKPKFSKFWEILLIQLQSTVNLLPLAIFQKKTQYTISFRKTHLFQLLKPFFERFENSYYFSCILQQNFQLRRFLLNQFFFEKPIYFNYCYQKFERFERSYFFSRVLPQVC